VVASPIAEEQGCIDDRSVVEPQCLQVVVQSMPYDDHLVYT